MGRDFQRPVVKPASQLDAMQLAAAPDNTSRQAHEVAWALLDRIRTHPDPGLVQRVVEIASGAGLDDLTELWAEASPDTLAGALWRLSLLRAAARRSPAAAALTYRQGLEAGGHADAVIAGMPEPVTQESVIALCDTILRGAFSGNLEDALLRAASYASIMAQGCTHLADSREATDAAHATQLTKQAALYASIGDALKTAARAWRSGRLS